MLCCHAEICRARYKFSLSRFTKRCKSRGFFWPVLTTDIRSCSQCQKVCFFPNLNKKIPNSRNKKKTGEKITKYRHFTMFMFVVERAGPNSPNDTREITKYCKLPNGNVPLRQFSRIYSRRCQGVCNIHTWSLSRTGSMIAHTHLSPFARCTLGLSRHFY